MIFPPLGGPLPRTIKVAKHVQKDDAVSDDAASNNDAVNSEDAASNDDAVSNEDAKSNEEAVSNEDPDEGVADDLKMEMKTQKIVNNKYVQKKCVSRRIRKMLRTRNAE